MSDYKTKQEDNQYQKVLHKRQLDEDRKAWVQKNKSLAEEINKLGYGNISLDDFLLKDRSQDEVSHFIKLQAEVNVLEEERRLLWVEELVVEELNKTHAALHHDQFYVLTEKPNLIFGGIDFSLESKQSFRSQYENKLVQCPDGKIRSKADIWLKSPLRREYKGIIFDPKQNIEGCYNLWKGFAKEPKQGDCLLYWNHVRDNICDNNEASYQYVRKWLSSIFQKPDEVHTAIVLCGSQGTGKNSFVEPLGVLFGQHYVLLSSIAELVSHFNYHLKSAVLIHGNECLWGGDRRDIGQLKAMITESTCLIEGKGKDRVMLRNFKHVILSSNEDWPVHLDADDRRFLVLRLSNAHKEDHDYFKAIAKQLNEGGYEALLYDLLNEDLTDFNPRIFPKSAAAFDIKFRSADSTHKYVYEVLLNGCFDIGKPDPGMVWQQRIPTHCAYEDYGNWSQMSGEKKVNNTIFGKNMVKLIPSIKKTRTASQDKRIWEYDLPSLKQAREEFCKVYKVGSEIWEGGVEPE